MRGLANLTKELILYALLLLEEDYPQTLRQLHYAIFCWWQRARGPKWQRRRGPQCQRSMAAGALADLPGRHWQFDRPPWTPRAIHTDGAGGRKERTG